MMTLLKKTLNYFFDEELLKHSSIMFIAFLIGGICNYLFQLYIGRALGPEEFGVFGSLFAIFYIISVLTATIQTSTARFISKFIGENDPEKIRYFLKKLTKKMLQLGIIIFLIILSLSSFISSFLKINSIIPIIILGSVFLFSFILPVNLGALQGFQKFYSLSINSILNYFSKLIFGVIFVIIGLEVNGAIGAIILGSGIALIASFIPLRRNLLKEKITNRNFNFSELYKYSFPVLIAMFCYSVPANVDLIIAKHVFDVNTAGLYTAATVLGKIILFIPGAIAVVMFPKISKLHAEKKDTTDIFIKCLTYTAGLSGIVALIYWFFPLLIIKITYGFAYIEVSPVMQLYGFVMFFFSLIVVLMRYSLAIHDVKFVYIFAFFTIFEILIISFFHSSMMEMVGILLFINSALFFSGLMYIVRIIVKKKT